MSPIGSWPSSKTGSGNPVGVIAQRGPRPSSIELGARSMRGRPKATTIDEYLAVLSEDKRGALERLRMTIRAAAPRAEEYISYQLPAFRLDGKPLVAFGATAKSHDARRRDASKREGEMMTTSSTHRDQGDSTGPFDRRSSNLGQPTRSPIGEEPVDPARAVENAKNAFPTSSLDAQTRPQAPQAYSFVCFVCFDREKKKTVR